MNPFKLTFFGLLLQILSGKKHPKNMILGIIMSQVIAVSLQIRSIMHSFLRCSSEVWW